MQYGYKERQAKQATVQCLTGQRGRNEGDSGQRCAAAALWWWTGATTSCLGVGVGVYVTWGDTAVCTPVCMCRCV